MSSEHITTRVDGYVLHIEGDHFSAGLDLAGGERFVPEGLTDPFVERRETRLTGR